jgi:hypothetical protein
MPKTLVVGSEEFEFPLSGENPGYASEITDWAGAVTDALSTVQKPNDILTTTASLANNVTTPTNIPGFSFSTAQVIAIDCRYFVKRVTTGPSATYAEVGYIEGSFDGTNWSITIRTTGDSGIIPPSYVGVLLSITPAGQIQYTSTNLPGSTHAGTITFEAKVINS